MNYQDSLKASDYGKPHVQFLNGICKPRPAKVEWAYFGAGSPGNNKTTGPKLTDKLHRALDNTFKKREINTPEEKQVIIMMFAAVFFSAACHIAQIFFFLFMGNPALVAINSFSICCYVACVALLNKKDTVFAGLIFTGEISVVAVLFTYFIGIDTFVFNYFFVILLIQMMIPYAGWKVRIPAIAMIMVLAFASLAVSQTYLPFTDITPIKTLYSVFNICVGLGSIISLVAVNNAVNKMISRSNKIKMDKYMEEAHLDTLTGLYNRRYAKIIFEGIHNDTEQRDTWCIAMLDIDDFKHINDNHGHESGDIVLQELARIIKSSLRKTDYVFRWGGEEFLMLLRDTDIDGSYRTLEKMRERIQKSEVTAGGRTIRMTVTIGLSRCFSDDIGHSIRLSDRNLYAGKTAGKNVVVM